MCGISGIVNGNVRPLKHALKHRGRDGDGEQFREMVAFGHNRLSVLDLSNDGAQPISSERYMLTYNGEIYNYKDFYSGTKNDAHALLDAINFGGVEHALRLLNGMYAFAVYDRVTETITLTVDRFGQKPLYYYHDVSTNVFAFASTPSALLCLKDKWRINKTALQSYWQLGSTMGTQSIWDGINRVEGSHYVTYNVKSGRLSQPVRYWTPQYIENAGGNNFISELVIDAIDKVKVSDVPVHIFLSGGIDSTLVASRFAGGNAIHLESNETSYAKMVADKYNISLNTVSPTEVNTAQCLIDYALKCGEPSMAGIIPYITAKEVSKYAKVAVTANGADELFFGYDRTQQAVTPSQHQHIFRRGFAYQHKCLDIDPRLSAGRWLELQAYIENDLNRTLDFAAMAHTVEVRAPFLDHRLVEAALSIPEDKHRTKEFNAKSILKTMLKEMGFDNQFLNRPKQGFSLHYTPKDMNTLKEQAYIWCQAEGFLTVNTPSKRDIDYLKMCALSFYWWYKTFKSIIE